MAGETDTIAEIAERISKDLFKFYRWKTLPNGLMNQNFNCEYKNSHCLTKTKDDYINEIKLKYETEIAKLKKEDADEAVVKHIEEKYNEDLEKFKEKNWKEEAEKSKTHPVDAVFYYVDPYSEKKIYFNTDLKSYAEKSINTGSIRKAINSLAETIECARESNEWQTRYGAEFSGEVRGLLFLLNHDGKFSNNIFRSFKSYDDQENQKDSNQKIISENLKIAKNQLIHIIDPATVCYMQTVKKDIAGLQQDYLFPKSKNNFHFFYPNLKRHRPRILLSDCPATVEMLCGPFMILEHESFPNEDENISLPSGYLIYYRIEGSTKEEFLFLLDTLSGFQILKEYKSIQIRLININYHSQAEENFRNAIADYIESWYLNTQAAKVLNEITFAIVDNPVREFLKKPISYRSLTGEQE